LIHKKRCFFKFKWLSKRITRV